jgi:hypothetical protein
MELIRMSRLCTCPSSWTRTPSSSSPLSRFSNAWVMATEACRGSRPVANALENPRDHVNLWQGQASALRQALHCAMEVGELPGCKWLYPVESERDSVGAEIRNKVQQHSNNDGHEQSIASANVAPCWEQKDR